MSRISLEPTKETGKRVPTPLLACFYNGGVLGFQQIGQSDGFETETP